MERKVVLVTMLTLLLTSMFTLAFKIHPVEANGDIIEEIFIPDFRLSGGTPGTQRSPQLDYSVTIETSETLQMQYFVRSTHSSSIRLHILVDGEEILVTDWLGWPGHPEFGFLDTGLLDLGPVSSGVHNLILSPEGRVGGSNIGWLESWGGSLKILVSKHVTTALSVSTTLPEYFGLDEVTSLDVLLKNTGDTQLDAGGYMITVEFWDYYERGSADSPCVHYAGTYKGEIAAQKLGPSLSETVVIPYPLNPGDQVYIEFSVVVPEGQKPSMVYADTLTIEATGPDATSEKGEYPGVDVRPSFTTCARALKEAILHALVHHLEIIILVGGSILEAQLVAAEEEISQAYDAYNNNDESGAARHAARAFVYIFHFTDPLGIIVSWEEKLNILHDAGTRFWDGHVSIFEFMIWWSSFMHEIKRFGFDLIGLTPLLSSLPPGLYLKTDPVNLFVVDPIGHRIGVDPTLGTVVNEISGAHMYGIDGVAETIFIPDLLQGIYTVFSTGLSSGSFSLHVEAAIGSELVYDVLYTNSIVEDAIYVYTVNVAEETITVAPDPETELEHLKEFIDGLPDDAFTRPRLASQIKNALFNKIEEVILKVEAGNYTDAINKLFHDIRAKMDEDSTVEDWVIDPETQFEICVIIDHIISSIETLQQE